MEGRNRRFDYDIRVNREVIDWRSKLFSVFVGNLSRSVSRRTLWDAFSIYGSVADVFIPAISQIGKRSQVTYGFVRFWNNHDRKIAIERGNNRFLEWRRIRVSNALPSREKINHTSMAMMKHDRSKSWAASSIDGRSFKEAVLVGASVSKSDEDKEKSPKDNCDDVHLEHVKNNLGKCTCKSKQFEPEASPSNLKSGEGFSFVPIEEFNFDIQIPVKDMEWLERSVVGRLNFGVVVKELQETFYAMGVNARISPISRISVLITFEEREAMKSFMDGPGELLESFFTWLKLWDNSMDNRDSLVWVKLEDVPLELWHINFFSALGEKWGKVVKISDGTLDRKSLEAAWILVEVERKTKIPALVAGKLNGHECIIKVTVVDELQEDQWSLESEIDPSNMYFDSDGDSVSHDSSVEAETPLETNKVPNVDSVEVVADSIERVDLQRVNNLVLENKQIGVYEGYKENENLDIVSLGLDNNEGHQLGEENILGKKGGSEIDSEATLSDTCTSKRNKAARLEAEKTWEIASMLGIGFEASKEHVIQALMEMEG